MTTHRLRDPKATRTGQVHYIDFRIDGDFAEVVFDDCMIFDVRRMTTAQAREEYQRAIAHGFRPMR